MPADLNGYYFLPLALLLLLMLWLLYRRFLHNFLRFSNIANRSNCCPDP